MDGRVQLPVIRYLQKRFNVDHVDSITETGPDLILSDSKDTIAIEAIFDRLEISVVNHQSVGVAAAGHHGCAGNPVPKNDHIKHIQKAVELLRVQYENLEIIGLWVDENWEVHEVI
jgi:hypothetical protein